MNNCNDRCIRAALYPYRFIHTVRYMGWVDLDLVSYSGWWAATVDAGVVCLLHKNDSEYPKPSPPNHVSDRMNNPVNVDGLAVSVAYQ